MKVRNVSGFDRLIAATGQTVEADGTVEVSDELGRSLCEQPANWEAVVSETKTKRKEGDD
jgi:hypothetical protein